MKMTENSGTIKSRAMSLAAILAVALAVAFTAALGSVLGAVWASASGDTAVTTATAGDRMPVVWIILALVAACGLIFAVATRRGSATRREKAATRDKNE
jgi:uncharacterized BrkB/YihY/UPF0761 family membrane protein